MTRRVALPLAAMLGASLLLASHSQAQQSPCVAAKVAIVQTRSILASIGRYAAQDSALALAVDAFKLDVSRLQGVVDSASRAYQEKSALLSPAARQVELRKLDAQDAQIQQRIQGLRQQILQQRERLLQPIENGVQKVIDSVRAELKCPVLFDASVAGGIASVNKSLDLTQRVIDRIRVSGDTAIFGPPKRP